MRCRKSGRVLMVDFNQRYLTRNRILKNVLIENRLGKIVSAHAFHNQDLRGLKSFAPLHREPHRRRCGSQCGVPFHQSLSALVRPSLTASAPFLMNRVLSAECGEEPAHCKFWFRNGGDRHADASLANAVDTSLRTRPVHFGCGKAKSPSDLKKSDIVGRLKVQS